MFAESWRGLRPLYKVFWIYYLLGIFLIASSVAFFVEIAPLLPEPVAITLIVAILLLIPLWKLWALVALWRCAPNSSSSGCKFLARAYVVVFTLVVIAGVIEKTYDEYRQKSSRLTTQQR